MSWASGRGVVIRALGVAAVLGWIVLGVLIVQRLKQADPPSSLWGTYWSWPIMLWTWVSAGALVAFYWYRLRAEGAERVRFAYAAMASATVLTCGFTGVVHAITEGGSFWRVAPRLGGVVALGVTIAVVTSGICLCPLYRLDEEWSGTCSACSDSRGLSRIWVRAANRATELPTPRIRCPDCGHRYLEIEVVRTKRRD
ncbi:MAG TPA: hypothetical protein QGH10_18185, partial [Armatimonadota bacterium]|nr:hypothetical protein [Armatimonadota bacterium]